MSYSSMSICNSCGFKLLVQQNTINFGHNVLPCPSCNVFSDFNDSIIEVKGNLYDDKIFRGFTR